MNMKIISHFTDYYDYLSKIYGQDEKIVYDRTKIIPSVRMSNINSDLMDLLNTRHRLMFNCGYDYVHALVIIDRVFFIKNLHQDPGIIDVNRLSETFRWYRRAKTQGEHIASLVKKVGHPVFIINTNNIVDGRSRTVDVCIDKHTPNLSLIPGLAKMYPADQIYQDLSYCIANTINDSPDVAGPTNISNSEKIVAAGFDLKQSFRHRK